MINKFQFFLDAIRATKKYHTNNGLQSWVAIMFMINKIYEFTLTNVLTESNLKFMSLTHVKFSGCVKIYQPSRF